jgi:hypothetical protein
MGRPVSPGFDVTFEPERTPMQSLVRTALGLALLVSPLFPQDVIAPGFARNPLPYPGATALAASLTLSTGEFVVFDGLSVVQHAPDGSSSETLGTFPSFVFPSFLAVDDAEIALYVGESSSGAIHRLFLGVSSAPDFLLSLPLNYDAAVRGDELWVSAATCGFGCGNELWRVDLPSLVPTLVATLPGASGPLALDSGGDVFYATASDQFPTPPVQTDVWRFSAAALAGALPLTLADATLVGGGFAGAGRLVRDEERDELYLLENNFGSGANRITLVRASAALSPVLFEGAPFLTLGNASLQVDAAQGNEFLAYQPAAGGSLVFTRTDFGSVVERLELAPRRPTMSVSGPGTLGAGTFTVALEGGVPHGFARLYYGPVGGYQANEPVFRVGGVPLAFGLALGTLDALPGLFALDASGGFTANYTNPGGYEGRFAMQCLVLAPGPKITATSGPGFL